MLQTTERLSAAAAPSPSGTMRQFHGKQFSHGPGWEGWFRKDSSTLHWLCSLFPFYYISSIPDHETLNPGDGGPLDSEKISPCSMNVQLHSCLTHLASTLWLMAGRLTSLAIAGLRTGRVYPHMGLTGDSKAAIQARRERWIGPFPEIEATGVYLHWSLLIRKVSIVVSLETERDV